MRPCSTCGTVGGHTVDCTLGDLSAPSRAILNRLAADGIIRVTSPRWWCDRCADVHVDDCPATLQSLYNAVSRPFAPRDASTTDESPREVVSVGWDGRTRPMYRYRDELHLPDHARSIVAAKDRPDRCPEHPAYEPDNCPGCGTSATIPSAAR